MLGVSMHSNLGIGMSLNLICFLHIFIISETCHNIIGATYHLIGFRKNFGQKSIFFFSLSQ
jgi:hypothetical protein